MNKNSYDSTKSLLSFMQWGAMIWGIFFIITFLVIIGFLGVFYPHSHKVALVSFLILTIVAIVAFFLMGAGILKCHAIYLRKDLDFSLFDDVNDVIIVSDFSGFIHYANQNYQRLFTYKPKTSCYAVLADLPGASALVYRLKVAASNNLAAQENFKIDRSIFIHSTQQQPILYNISIHPIIKRKQKFLLWRIADISHFQEHHESSSLNLQEATNHLNHTPVGFLSVNAQGVIIYLNSVFAKWFSIDLTNFIVGQYSFDQLFYNTGNNSKWSDIRDICLQNNKYQNSNCATSYVFSLSLTLEDGSKKLLKCFMYVSSFLEDETIYRIVLLPQKMQESERDCEEKLPSTLIKCFDASPFAMAVMDQKRQLVHVNYAFLSLLGCTDKDINLYNIISHSYHAQLEHAFRQVTIYKNYPDPIDTVLANNKERRLRLYVTPLIQCDDLSHNFVIISALEITKQKTLNDDMVQSQKMQAVGQLAGGIAHDFNNVLTAILMSCDLLLNTHRVSDPAHADLTNIKNNANRAAALVQQLLAFSRKQTLRPEKVDFTEFLSDIRNLILPLLGNHIQLKIIHGRDLWSVKVDQASFQCVVMNLVINARDAMPDGGIVTIATNNITRQQSAELNYVGLTAGEYVQLTIADTGSGISAAVQEKMFEPFFTTKEIGKGTGLGLSMVYGIIKQTGGYIHCNSQEGEGTIFHIFLPRYVSNTRDEIIEQIEKAEEQEHNTDLTGSATVLLVEDEDAVRMGGVRALQMRGYTVLEAASGVEALAVLEENKGVIDIIVSDVVMPGMDGPTLLKEVRKSYPDIKFIFVSGYTKDAFTKSLPEGAIFGFLSKPFSIKQLILAVKERLEE
ncbi:response regulator [Bartonella bacilliformis]|uniref:histidine kinase n=1 Tax=Bartonella bacilliformis Ver097 TaxID=1293911 RepID=A0A072R3E9_BARBA|nr:response regulator [Bartonella bacilliformis]KEG19722.1 hypothetical protein H710_00938 [Bartonella bacilliformis Ver097]